MPQSSYQLIDLTANIVLTWPFSFAGGPVVADINDITTPSGAFAITLPNATLATAGQNFIFNNISAFSFEVLANDGITVLRTLGAGEVIEMYLIDSSTSNGTWRIVPYGSGTNAIVALQAESSDSSIVITNGDVTPPGGIIDFQLPTSLTNLNTSITSVGFPVITGLSPLTWTTVDFVGDSNIKIVSPGGQTGDPTFSLASTIGPISSLQVGNMTLSGEVITNDVVNGNVQISTNGTGQTQLNGVGIDINGNLTGINNMTVSGFFNNPFTPKAYCTFSDTIVGSSNTIIIQDSANVVSITGSAGTYTITFNTALGSINYGVLITLGTTGGSLPFISNGYYLTRQTTSVTIVVTDASGELVLSAPNGVTVVVMSTGVIS